MKTLGFFLFLLLVAAPVEARQLSVGLAIPQGGPFAPFGEQIREAFTAWQTRNPGQFADIVEGEDDCDAASGAEAANSFSEAGVDVVVGYLCTESLVAALPVLAASRIPVLTLNVRADIVGEEAQRFGWPFFRLAPRASQEAAVAADAIVALWADKPFALIEDGTIQGRELAESIRARLEERGLTPAFVDNYRPGQDRQPSLVRRLAAADVSRVFVGGERRDAAIIARDAAEAGLDIRIMGGDALHAAMGEVPLPEGALAIVAAAHLPDAASEAAQAAFAALGVPLEGMRLSAYAAADILGAAATRLSYSEASLVEILRSQRFETALGPVSFDETGERREPGFTLAVWRGDHFERTSPREIAAQGESGQ